MSTLLPRFQGNAVQNGKHWTWELFITIGELEPIVMASKEPCISRDAALKKMKDELPGIMEAVCEAMGLPKPEGVHDLKKNVAQSMDDWLKTK